jgi:diaminohydroxyphosphoribosylaminopyrimidine deaminase/5-amino-6-(5-phosphoribosylamino)uracil reductase
MNLEDRQRMEKEHDETWMRRAIALAMRGRGAVEPNPMVGCVIVRDGKVLGEGFHAEYGGPHAEPNALSGCLAEAAGATAYVTLEPCCHLEKKTPPCVPLLIRARLKRVAVGCLDPNPMVAGQGMDQLREAGIFAQSEVLGAACRQLNAAFFKRMEHRRPYVTLKWAQTADKKVAGPGGKRIRISNGASMKAIHGLRARSDAILVGIGTALADDPLLTSRSPACKKQPLRIVLDRDLRLPATSQLARTTSEGPVLVYCGESVYRQKHAAVAALGARGVEVAWLRENSPVQKPASLSLTHLLDDLGGRSITHLLVDSGPTLARSFLGENLADRVWIVRSSKPLLDENGLDAPRLDWESVGDLNLEGDRLNEYLNPKSLVYFCGEASADLKLVRE